MIKSKMLTFTAVLMFGSAITAAYGQDSAWRENFNKDSKAQELPDGWAVKATVLGTPETSFKVKNTGKDKSVLMVHADKATGGLMCNPSLKVDLTKTPILRWRWRVENLPKGGDSRKQKKDDQAIAIYIGANDWLRKKSISYRYENETPKGSKGTASYGGGIIKVKWFCLRNKKSGTGKWFTEERNIAEDFKKAFGFVPKEFALSVCANSQHTGSETKAEIDYIEFVAPDKTTDTQLAQRTDKK
ncbi:DUF3047 domain-containing protein [Lentisphaerota bacterium ZTH]|nr:DUF3047 domain-containing protein [Lentisphaerota bacterium]WET06207.1 DUF3047 domain-containing protein [Lentisphaerota bacterium ZTH]